MAVSRFELCFFRKTCYKLQSIYFFVALLSLVLVTLNVKYVVKRSKKGSDAHKKGIQGRQRTRIGNEAFIGMVNVYEWDVTDFCIETTNGAYWNPLFPHYPSSAKLIKGSGDHDEVTNSAIRRFLFYLYPNVSGNYVFRVNVRDSCDLFITEVKISNTGHSIAKYELRPSEQLVKTVHHKTITLELLKFDSQPLFLNMDSAYLVDVVHVMKRVGKFKLEWKRPHDRRFELIDKDLILPYSTNESVNITLPKSPVKLQTLLSRKVGDDARCIVQRRPVLQIHDLNTVIQECTYYPSYLVKQVPKLYEGWRKIIESRSYPTHYAYEKETENAKLQPASAHLVTTGIMELFQQSGLNYYKLSEIVFVEENPEKRAGKRYFVELDIIDSRTNSVIRLSDYFYQPTPSSPLCFPKGHEWKKDVQINIIVTTSESQKRWMLVFMDTIKSVVETNQDRNLHIIIVNFGSSKTNYEYELKTRHLNFTILQMTGKFNKVKGFNEAARSVVDSESIIFTMDLHLQIPIYLFDDARKSTILGKTVYAPILLRLPCGEHPEYTSVTLPIWVFNGFGLLSMYKKDWDIIGGMNEKMFGEKWGGEDWEIMDRIVGKQYEVIRRKLPGFYHIYHSRKRSAWYS